MTITNITLGQLRVLTMIVEDASFSTAATRIGMTQSGASQAMRSLEGVLGVKLLVRGKNGVFPTEIGQAVLQDAREAVLAIERIQQRSAAASGAQTGRLRIGSVASAVERLLPQILARFQRLFPGVELVLLEGTDHEVLEWVETAVVDVGLTSEQSAETVGDVVLEDDFVFLAACDHPLAATARVKLCDLADENFIMSGSGCEPVIRQLFASVNISPKVVLTVRDTAALVEMVSQGIGVTLMPELSTPEGDARVCRIPIVPCVQRRLLVVSLARANRSPAAEKFVQLLAP
ncbi:LysR family transcriptional regulator [Mesorhizobium sp. M0011]|uniref:LysR family transcriptional regulator n=1 Tax=Mesorhizobium sp. M0011 TaxID=2956839 RepID=UPI003335983B